MKQKYISVKNIFKKYKNRKNAFPPLLQVGLVVARVPGTAPSPLVSKRLPPSSLTPIAASRVAAGGCSPTVSCCPSPSVSAICVILTPSDLTSCSCGEGSGAWGWWAVTAAEGAEALAGAWAGPRVEAGTGGTTTRLRSPSSSPCSWTTPPR